MSELLWAVAVRETRLVHDCGALAHPDGHVLRALRVARPGDVDVEVAFGGIDAQAGGLRAGTALGDDVGAAAGEGALRQREAIGVHLSLIHI